MPDANLKKLYYKTYLSVIEGSIGTKMFQHAWVCDQKTNEEKDIMNDGEYSCAFFVTGILTLMQYIDRPHATVSSALAAIEKYGWTKTNTPKQGDIIHWEKHPEFGTEHVGFYWDTDTAISNSYQAGTPIQHPLQTERKILGYWTRDYSVVLEK